MSYGVSRGSFALREAKTIERAEHAPDKSKRAAAKPWLFCVRGFCAAKSTFDHAENGLISWRKKYHFGKEMIFFNYNFLMQIL